MRLPFLRRLLPVAGFTVLGALGVSGLHQAEANVEVGVTAGLHTFNDDNELGVADTPDATSPRNTALFGLRIGFTVNDMLGIEVEGGVLPTEDRNLVYDLWIATARAHLIAQFRAENPDNQLVPFAVVGAGGLFVVKSDKEERIGKDEDFYPYIGVGAKYRVENGWGLRGDVRALFPPSSDSESLTLDTEFLLSVYKEFGRKEKVVEEVIPPPPPDEDPDKDGISGTADQCPNDPEDADGFQDDDGCPDGDNDGDGIADGSDQCPGDAEDVDSFKDEDGCPDPDNDGDGIADGTDQCPNEAEDADGFQDEDGCPDPDNDGDGVPDAQDQCQDKAETKNGFEDGDGCPDELPAAVKKYSGTVKGINFKTNSAVILKSSNKVLDGAVKVLTDYPDLRIEIQGHTDDVGDNDANYALSDARAASVRNYFLSKGIADNRITSKGFGETVPTTPIDGLKGAKLKAARAANRRVEFKLISDLTQTDSAAPTTATPDEPTPPATEPAPAPAPAPTP
jgi:OOP family OmpA-OmpF porin